jgi:hypothetical protein
MREASRVRGRGNTAWTGRLTLGYAPLSLPSALSAVLLGLGLGAAIDECYAKEDGSEHIGPPILVAIIVLFAIVGCTVARAVALAAFFSFVLGQELDWVASARAPGTATSMTRGQARRP